MKILYLVHQFFPEYYTGTEKFVSKISSMMQKVGYGARVITYSYYQDSFFEKEAGDILYRESTYKGIPVTMLRHKRIPENINIAMRDKRMKDFAEHVISTEEPDIVHVGHPMRVNEFIFASQRLNIPYIVTLTDFWLICPKVNLVNSRGSLCAGPGGGKECVTSCPELPHEFMVERAGLARSLLFGAKKVVSPSKFLGGIFKNELGSLDIAVVNHGISYSKIKRNNKNYTNEDTLVFCYAGSLNYHKGIHVLIDAFKMITSSNVVLKIFGSGPDSSYVDKLIDQSRSDRRIEFCGIYSEEDVGDIFSNVDVVITPSLVYENYPLVLHEALACNTPVVASNIGGMAEKVKDGINGFTFPVGNAGALHAVMMQIVVNPTILNTLKERIKVSSVSTIEQEACTYNRIYTNVNQ